MGKRIVVGAISLAILLTLIWVHGWVLAVVAAVAALIAEYEMIAAAKHKELAPVAPVLYGYTALLLPTYYFIGFEGVVLLMMLAAVCCFIFAIFSKKHDFTSVRESLFMLIYPQLLFLFLYIIIFSENIMVSRMMLLISFASSVMTDICAYFVGSLCGKRKLCPEISPKKTVEGAFGGLLGGIIGLVAVVLLMGESKTDIGWYILLGLVLSVMSQLGDLSASLVKRHYGVKDFGWLFPGHGGMMDRLDSTLFTMPMVCAFFRLIFHITL